MGCEICGGSNCIRSFHSIADQEDHDKTKGDVMDERNALRARIAVRVKVAEAADKCLKLETDGFQFANRQRPNMMDADIFRAETLRLIENHNNAYRQAKIDLRAALDALKEGT